MHEPWLDLGPFAGNTSILRGVSLALTSVRQSGPNVIPSLRRWRGISHRVFDHALILCVITCVRVKFLGALRQPRDDNASGWMDQALGCKLMFNYSAFVR